MNSNNSILIIDEESYLLRNFLPAAESAGYQVIGTAVVDEGYHLAKTLRPDVILLNTSPPDGHGLELCRRVKADPALSGTYIMRLSAMNDPFVEQTQNPEPEVDDYVSKPIASRDLLAQVRAMLRVKHAESQLSKALQALQRKNEALLKTQNQLNAFRQRTTGSPVPTHEQLDAFPPGYEEFYDALPVGYCTIDKFGLIVEANLTAARLLGTKRSVLIDTLFPDYIVEDDVGRFFAYLTKVFETNSRKRCELRLAQQESTLRYVLLESIPVQQGQEALPQCTTIITDITPYKQAKKSAHETERFYHKLLTHLSDVVFMTDDQGLLTFISPNVKSLFGYSEEEIRNFGNIDQVIGRQPFKLDDRQELLTTECEITAKSGRKRILTITVKRVALQKGTILYSCRDITEDKQLAKEACLQARQITQQTTETPPDIMYIYDRENHKTIYPIHQVPSFLGYPPQKIQEMEPMAFESFFHPSDLTRLELFRQQWELGATDDDILEIEYRLTDHQGEWRWFRAQEKVLLRDADETVKQIFGNAWDITEYKSQAKTIQKATTSRKSGSRQRTQTLTKPSKSRRRTTKRRRV